MKASSSSTQKNYNFAAKKKIWLLIPAAIALLTVIMLTIFAFTANSTVNMGMDFVGGYAISIKSTEINDDNRSDYECKIESIAKNLSDSEGENYGLKYLEFSQIGEDSLATLRVGYKSLKGLNETEMGELGEAFQDALAALANIVPEVETSGSDLIVTYDRTMSAFAQDISAQIKSQFPSTEIEWANAAPISNPDTNEVYFTQLKLKGAASLDKDAVIGATTIVNDSSFTISSANKISPSINVNLIIYSVLAVIIALVLAFGYFAIRFKSVSLGYTAVLGLLLDMAILLCLMMIFHIEISGLIIAAVIATLIYSVYNKIIVFDNIKENVKAHANEIATTELINTSINQSLKRTLFILAIVLGMTAILTIVCLIGNVFAVLSFALPFAFGLIAAAFTSLLFVPLLWSTINKNIKKPRQKTKTIKKETKTI